MSTEAGSTEGGATEGGSTQSGPTLVVDAHHHLWRAAEQDWTADLPPLHRDFTLADLEPELAAAGVDRTILVETVNLPGETPELLALAAESAVVAGVVGWVDLTAPDVTDRVAELRAGPGGERLLGLRHQVQGEPDPDWLVRADVLRGLAAVAEAGLVFELLVLPHQLPAAVEAVRATPGGRFVLAHLGKPGIAAGEREPWAARVRELAGHDHVAAKLSGLVTEAAETWTSADLQPYAEHALDVFGADRLMLGSDWPVCLLRGGYQQVWATYRELVGDLTPVETTAVLGGTALGWYRC